MKKYLLIRFSAMGDVVLAAQVARSALLEHPDIHLFVMTRPGFRPFFKPAERITFIDVELSGRHKGFAGLFRLANETLAQTQLDGVLDVHNVLRSRVLGAFFRLRGIPVFHLKKDRKGRKALTREKNRVLKPLKTITESMMEVWGRAGFHFSLKNIPRPKSPNSPKKIGIAPTASTQTKTYPLPKMKAVIQLLVEEGHQIYLLGGGNKDEEVARYLRTGQGDRIVDAISGNTLSKQMSLIQGLDLMLTMDSSNMHLARYLGVPVVSIWGATHPYSGYGPVMQKDEGMMVQVPPEELACRPCSIFGQKACYREKMYCLEGIEPEQVAEVVRRYAEGGGRQA